MTGHFVLRYAGTEVNFVLLPKITTNVQQRSVAPCYCKYFLLAVVHYLVIKLFQLGITETINTFPAPEFFKYLVKIR